MVALPGRLSKLMRERASGGVQGDQITVRARIERNDWTVSIHPAGIEGAKRVVAGARERAELVARSMIDRWRAAKRSEER